MPDQLTTLAYRTFQQGKGLAGLTHKNLSTQLMRLLSPGTVPEGRGIAPELMAKLQEAMAHLQEEDLADVDAGIYPASQLFDTPWQDIARFYPLVWFDMPRTWDRARNRRYQDFDAAVETDGLPSYYVQNFHHQTGGYLTDESANLYDLQVEILFNGTADPMRRRVLKPVVQSLRQAFGDRPERDWKVLDVACGTGRTLRNLRASLPKAKLYGTDLSAAYLRKANELLAELPGELPQLIQANGERLPYQDGMFQAVTSVFLFHELPPEARQNVINECFRVLEPGGTLVICDSIQRLDSPDFEQLMENFPAMFHEPYYRHYTQDDFGARLQTSGFELQSVTNWFMSKYWVARKPH